MDISVIIPTYRPQAYLWECLDSLNRQTLSKSSFEVVLVLNGEQAPYDALIDDYIRNHPDMNIVFLKTTVGGVSNARNLGLDQAQGDYITFLDDDDYLSDSCLEELLSNVDRDTVAICYPYAFKDGAPQIQCFYPPTQAYEYCVSHACQTIHSATRKFFSGPCMKLIPVWMIGDRRYDVYFIIGEDSIFMFLISDRMQAVRFTSKNAVYYRRFRKHSMLSSQNLRETFVNYVRFVQACTKIYFSGNYSFYLYSTRLLGIGSQSLFRIKYWLKDKFGFLH